MNQKNEEIIDYPKISESRLPIKDNTVNIEIVKVASKKDPNENEPEKLNCFVLGLFYFSELVFYPILNLIFSITYICLCGFACILVGTFMSLLIPLFPFFLIFCFFEAGRTYAKILCALSVASCFIILIGAFLIIISALMGLYQFFNSYYLIISGKVNPNNSLKII